MKFKLNLPGKLRLDGSHISQFAGSWAIEPTSMNRTLQVLQTIDLQAHVDADHGPPIGGYEIVDGVAVIELSGVMSKRGSSMSTEGSTVLARQSLRQAARDDDVHSVLLVIESPGGTVSGTKELADDFAAIQKPTHAHIEDIGASAAYWVAAAADTITANEMATVGSIGVYTVINDLSKAAENDGIKVHVIKAGEMKGAGVPGTEVTDDILDELQTHVDAVHEKFVNAVSQGRKLSKSIVSALADGRAHMAEEAMGLGLIDAVCGLDNVVLDLAAVHRMEIEMAKESHDVIEAAIEEAAIVETDAATAAPVGSSEAETTDTPLAVSSSPRDEAVEFLEMFGAECGFQYYAEGLSLEEAAVRFTEKLQSDNKELQDKIDALELAGGESDPASGDNAPQDKKAKKHYLQQFIRMPS